MWFASYLQQKGVITSEQLANAIYEQLSLQEPIGAIAVRTGMLTIKQVFEVLDSSSIGCDEPFGQLAIELGLLNKSQLAELLFEQAQNVRSLGDILVEQGAITRRQLIKELQLSRYSSTYKRSVGDLTEATV